VHHRIIGICFQSYYNRSSTTYIPMQFPKETVQVILSTCVRKWDMAHIFVAIPQILLAYDRNSSAMRSAVHISLSLSLHNCHSHSATNTDYTINQFLGQNIRHAFTWSWQQCSLHRNIIVVRAELRLTCHSANVWHAAQELIVTLHLSLLGMSCLVIEFLKQLESTILFRMTLLDFYDANLLIHDILWMIYSRSGIHRQQL
jgi:hypothetical protein